MSVELYANLVLIGMAMLVAVSMVRFHANPQYKNFNLIDIITTHEGKVSRPALLEVGTWTLVAWGFVVFVNKGTLSDWYMGGFLGAFVLRAAHAAYLSAHENRQPSSKVDNPDAN